MKKEAFNNKPLIVFDFDGTLVNSMGNFGEIAASLLSEHFNCSLEWARQRYKETSGQPFDLQIDEIFPPSTKNDEVKLLFKEAKRKIYKDCSFYPDTLGTLQWLQKNNFTIAISSNNEQDILDTKIAEHRHFFTYILGYRNNFYKGEDHFNFIRQTWTGDILFIGDSLHDGLICKSNNIKFIAKLGTFEREYFTHQNIALECLSNLNELTHSNYIAPALLQRASA